MQTHKFVLYKYCLLVKEIVFLISLIITFLSIKKKRNESDKNSQPMKPFTGLRSHHFVDVWICTLTIECNQHMIPSLLWFDYFSNLMYIPKHEIISKEELSNCV